MPGALIAVDWGTTNRRAYRLEEGRVTHVERDGRGVLGTPAGEFPQQAAALRGVLGDLPLLCVGMVGSRRGWREMPYVPTPAGMQAATTRTTAAVAAAVSVRAFTRSGCWISMI